MPPRVSRAARRFAASATLLVLVLAVAATARLHASGNPGVGPANLPAPGEKATPPNEPLQGGNCLACPAFDFGCFTPTLAWQTHSASTGPGSGDCNWYCFDVVAATPYEFTTCTPGSADFDTLFTLVNPGGCGTLASNDDACGLQSRITWTATYTGKAHLELAGFARATGRYTLAHRVVCDPPANTDVGPARSSTTEADCSREVEFTVTTDGTGPLTYDWFIVPPPGGSATPASGTIPDAGSTATFTSLLQGVGGYEVHVTATNACGAETTRIIHALEDQRAPTITTTAEPAACAARAQSLRTQAELPGETGLLARVATLSRQDLEAALLSSPDPAAAEAALAAKLGLAKSQVRVFDRNDPGLVTPPGAAALGCATPCTAGTLTEFQPFYDVALDCADGDFTARTGASHSVTIAAGSPQNVIFGGSTLTPGTSDVSFHVHDTGTTYLEPPFGSACLFDPPDTAGEQGSVGIEQEWTRTPVPGMNLLLRQEIVAFGTTEDDSGVRLTLGATNLASSTLSATIGVRWQVDYQNASDDGPWYARVTCGPPFGVDDERFTEHEFLPAEIADFYRIQNNTGTPVFGNFSSTTALADYPGTGTPDRLIYGRWPDLTGSPWGYVANEGADADLDSAVLYYFGYLPADGITLAPGDSFRRSVIIFTAGENQDCGSRHEGACTPSEVTICPRDCATVGATATDACGAATVSLVDATPGAPPCAGNPCTAAFPDVGTFVYTWEAVDEAGNAVRCTSTVHVVDLDCNEPPAVDAGPDESRGCDDGLLLGATASDPDGDPLTVSWTSDCGATFSDPTRLDPVVTFGSSCDVACTLTVTVDDGQGGTASDSLVATVDDVTPPVLVGVPADVTISCADPVPPPARVTAEDSCDPAPGLTFEEETAAGACADERTITRAWTATDACGNVASASQVISVRDLAAPVPTALFLPALPAPPRSAASPRSACSSPSSALLRVECSAVDDCDPAPSVAARLRVTHHDVPTRRGPCVVRVETMDVACGDVIEVRLLAAPCPARGPRSPRPAFGVTSAGVPFAAGESVVLEVVATDRCGNAATAAADPTATAAPPCEDPLVDGSCCPLLARPAAEPCRTANCN